MSLPQATWAEAPWISHILPQCPKRHLCCQESKIKDEKLRHFFPLSANNMKNLHSNEKKKDNHEGMQLLIIPVFKLNCVNQFKMLDTALVKKTQTAKAVITPHLYKTLLISFFFIRCSPTGVMEPGSCSPFSWQISCISVNTDKAPS